MLFFFSPLYMFVGLLDEHYLLPLPGRVMPCRMAASCPSLCVAACDALPPRGASGQLPSWHTGTAAMRPGSSSRCSTVPLFHTGGLRGVTGERDGSAKCWHDTLKKCISVCKACVVCVHGCTKVFPGTGCHHRALLCRFALVLPAKIPFFFS